jgi:hypothetical protein
MQGRLKSYGGRGYPDSHYEVLHGSSVHGYQPAHAIGTSRLHGAAMKKHSPNSDTWRALQKFRAAYPSESQAQIFARFLSAKNAAARGGSGTAPKKQLTFFDTAECENKDPKKL